MSFTLTGLCEFREEIRKSRFITLAAPITSPQDAQAFFEQHSDLNATHNCWAWKLGDQYRSSDDGEPGGTAGRPMLAAIDGQGFDRVAVVVTRWYGGILLGTGGLVRAYTDAVAQALLGAEKVLLQRMTALRCTVPYALEGRMRRELEAAGALLGEVSHGAQVELNFQLPETRAAALKARLDEAGQGRVGWLAPA